MTVVRKMLAVVAVGIVLACSESSVSEEPGQKEAAIRELMDLTGAGDMGIQAMDQMGAAMGMGAGDDFDGFWEEFSSKVNADEVVDLVVPIYAKHFELDEIEEMIRFYETPLGQKTIRVLPEIMQESMAVGMEWGQSLAMEAMTSYEQREGK